MLTDVVRAHLATTAEHHEAVAAAALAEADYEAAAIRGEESSRLVEAAERLPQNRRAPLVLPARRAERMAAALASPTDRGVAMTHARAAECIRALLEDRPAHEIDAGTLRPIVAKAEEPPVPPSEAAPLRRSVRQLPDAPSIA